MDRSVLSETDIAEIEIPEPEISETAGSPPPPVFLAGIALVGMAALLFEVTLTRIFAVQMWYHFSYLVVCLALLGLGASGSLLAVVPAAETEEAVSKRLGLFATGCGTTIILSALIASRIRINTFLLWKSPNNFLGLVLCFAILSVPFLLTGLTVGSVICWRPRSVGGIYFFDLTGSALGGFSAPWLLGQLHTDTVVMLAGLIAVTAGAIFTFRSNNFRRALHSLPVVIVALLATGLKVGGVNLPPLHWRVPFAPGKIFAELFFPAGESEKTLPSATAQVDVSAPLKLEMLMAGDAGAQGKQAVSFRGVTQDGTAPTALFENGGNFRQFRSFNDMQPATAFIAGAAIGKNEPNVLVIGVGGGADVMMSLFFGARNVTAVEINTAMVKMVNRDYADYIGHLFSNPKVRLITEDGRSYLKRTQESYDNIQLSGVDTYTALSTGAYTLSENYLYTVEAVMDMYARLKEGGYINYSRPILASSPDKPPRETLRLANIARTALMRMGVVDPWKNIVVFQGETWASTIIRKGPFTDAESQALRRFAARERFFGLVFDPLRPKGQPADNAEDHLLRVTTADIMPPARGDTGGQVNELMESSLRAALRGDQLRSNGWVTLAAMTLSQSPEDQTRIARELMAKRDAGVADIGQQLNYRRQVLTYFERVLRGSDEERRLFIDSYFYDLRPPSDDSPFFFDYFKFQRAFYALRTVKSNPGSEWFPEFPVGHIVLISSLLGVVILAGILILLPLAALSRAGHDTPGKLRYFFYFACLACGFMFVEISLIQRFTLFLGHPTYSLSVVLTGILAFSGLGALVSSRLTVISRPVMMTLLLSICGLLVLDRFALTWILSELIGLERHYRIIIATLILAPTSFAMGFPFSLGIKLLRQQAPVLIPWAWAINGFLSVAGSILAIMLAVSIGFSAVLLAGALIYAVGFIVLPSKGSGARQNDARKGSNLYV